MRNRMDEHDSAYGARPAYGFEFTYRSRRLGRSRAVFEEAAWEIDPAKHNNDDAYPLYVKCGTCGVYMDFRAGPTGDLDGHWRCPNCGVRVRELTAYTALDRENREFEAGLNRDRDEDWNE